MATTGDEYRPARERILDAAVVVLREQGIAHATTKRSPGQRGAPKRCCTSTSRPSR